MPYNKLVLDHQYHLSYHLRYHAAQGILVDDLPVVPDASPDYDAVIFQKQLVILYRDRLGNLMLQTAGKKSQLLRSRNTGRARITAPRLLEHRFHLYALYILHFQDQSLLCFQNLARLSEAPQVIAQCSDDHYLVVPEDHEHFSLFFIGKNNVLFQRRFGTSWSSANAVMTPAPSLQDWNFQRDGKSFRITYESAEKQRKKLNF